MSLRIRSSLERADWEFVREACARTGNAGEPLLDRARWPFFAEQWIGPYERLRPEWSYVAEEAEEEGSRLGYLTGSPDSTRFYLEKRWLFDVPLAIRTFLGGYAPSTDVAGFRHRLAGEILEDPNRRGPRDAFPVEATSAVEREFPAHLHVNLLASARGKGVGRALVDRFRADLAAIGVRGIHLYCGEKPVPFYERVGFRELDRIEFRPGVFVYRLGSRF